MIEALKIFEDHGARPSPKSSATEHLIDACFAKMNSVYGQYKFSNEQWCEMMKLSPNNTKLICDIEQIPMDKLTYGDLRDYYDLHIKMWKSFNSKANSLNDRLKKITQT